MLDRQLTTCILPMRSRRHHLKPARSGSNPCEIAMSSSEFHLGLPKWSKSAFHYLTIMAVSTTPHPLLSPRPAMVGHFRHLSWLLLPLSILTISASVSAHAGHGNEFGSQEGSQSTNIQIDGATAKQIGVQTVAAKKQSLNVEIAATGQIELLPSQKVEVTAPIKGKVIQLLVQPGSRVKAGQVLATLSSPELNELRTSSLEKRSTAIALLQQAQTDRTLAQQSYSKIVEIATAETNQEVN
jgi:membrane fusion protein, heavy metal efflux system